LIVSPVFAGSVALLFLNDRVLKAAWPGFVTGKLSDVAGVVMVAVGLTAMLRRAGAAFSLTIVGFTLLKTVPAVAVLAAPVLGGVTLTDPTDLAALLALVPLWVWVHRAERPATTAVAWEVPIRVALIGAAVFATSATSCASSGINQIGEIDGRWYAVDAQSNVYTTDDGFDWRKADDAAGRGVSSLDGRKDEDCAGGRCFALVSDERGDLIVETSASPPTELLTIDPNDWTTLDELPALDGCGWGHLYGIDAIERPDGVHVAVATGVAGLLVMDADGVWRWAAAGEFGVAASPSGDDTALGFEVASDPSRPPTSWGLWVARLLPATVVVAFLAVVGRISVLMGRAGGSRLLIWGWALIVAVVYVLPHLLILGDDFSDPRPAFIGVVHVGYALAGACGLGLVAALLYGVVVRRRRAVMAPPDPAARVG
jgi:hypothetical protein